MGRQGRWVMSGLAFATAAAAFVACGSDDNGNTSSGDPGGAGAGLTSGQGGATGVGGFTGTSSSGGAGQGAAGGSCAGDSQTAEPIPLDMYIMLDASGSMTDKTGTMGQGVEKWSAVTGALSSFFGDPESAGIGVGMQFFPLVDPAAPTSCNNQADCGSYGPCILSVCDQSGVICASNADCMGGGGQCVSLGQCANDPTTFCLPLGAFCPGMKGQCVQVGTSTCLNIDSCAAADYATPAVPMGTLNGNAAALDAAMVARTPLGGTPTSAALQGAIDFAGGWASSNPEHTVVAVLATDGLPTECDPTDTASIAQIAAAGFSGSPSIPTFVIGVFGGNDQAAQNTLNQIAAAGGTNTAFFIDQSGDVEMGFAAALEAIQGTALACEYQIPEPSSGQAIDYDQINVEHTPPGQSGPDTVLYVGDPANCDPTTGGWYYDVDPSQGEPTKILVCPQTCQAFQAGGTVDIRVGCATVVAPPK